MNISQVVGYFHYFTPPSEVVGITKTRVRSSLGGGTAHGRKVREAYSTTP
jgi:uncharacterized protein YjlB